MRARGSQLPTSLGLCAGAISLSEQGCGTVLHLRPPSRRTASPMLHGSTLSLVPTVPSARVAPGPGSAEPPAAWPRGVSCHGRLSAASNSVVWYGRRDGVDVEVVVLDTTASALERARFAEGSKRLLQMEPIPGLARVVEVDERGCWYIRARVPAIELSAAAAQGEWKWPARLQFVADLLEVLHSLHANALVHGALCPRNVMVALDGRPLIAEAGTVDVALLDGRDAGCPAEYAPFAAPEVLAGESFDASADTFAVGRLIEYLSSGRELGSARSALGPWDEAATKLSAIVDAATAEQIQDRYVSAREMMRALRVVIDLERSFALPEFWPNDAMRSACEPDQRLLGSSSPGTGLTIPLVLAALVLLLGLTVWFVG